MPEFPSHASPYLSPHPIYPNQRASEHSLTNDAPTSVPSFKPAGSVSSISSGVRSGYHSRDELDRDANSTPALPASIVSPAFTPPSTPGGLGLAAPHLLHSKTRPSDKTSHTKAPKLLPRLPNVECIVRARIPTVTGTEMFLHLYQNDADNKEHLAIVFGNTIRSRSLDRVREGETEMDRMIRGAYIGRLRPGRVSSRYDDERDENNDVYKQSDNKPEDGGENTGDSKPTESGEAPIQAPLVRIHSECYTGETAWSARCDCGEQLDEAARLMSEPSSSSSSQPSSVPGGVIVYLRQEGRGIGLGEKLKAYNLQDLGSDTVEANLLLRHPADARSYGLATAMLVDLGLGVDSTDVGIRLLTNNPDKVRAVEGPSREVTVKERVPMIPLAWRSKGDRGIRSTEIEDYLRTKIGKMGHMIE